MNLNLITDKWIPVLFIDGTTGLISPHEIVNPNIIDIKTTRADFKGALYQLLIALLQISIAPENDKKWFSLIENPIAIKELEKQFLKLKDYFNLLSETGKPAFMQDLELTGIKKKIKPKDKSKNENEGKETSIGHLLIDNPAENAIKKNTDHFIKTNANIGFCLNCTATALFCLQINAPEGGQGHLTSLRGGGPLTTLLFPNDSTLWQKLIVNLSSKKQFPLTINQNIVEVLPWLKKLECFNKTYKKIKKNSKYEWKYVTLINDEGINRLQTFWSMSRRIRLKKPEYTGHCNICGKQDVKLIKNYITKTHGINYYDYWQHPLSPHNTPKGKIEYENPLKGKAGGIGIQDWLGLNFYNKANDFNPAKVITSYYKLASKYNKKLKNLFKNHINLWSFGYDLESAKVNGYYDQQTPVVYIEDEDQRKLFISEVKELLKKIKFIADELKKQLQEVWFNVKKKKQANPKYKVPNIKIIYTKFYAEIESFFYDFLKIYEQDDTKLITECKKVTNEAKKIALIIFDYHAMNSKLENTDLKRIVKARKILENLTI